MSSKVQIFAQSLNEELAQKASAQALNGGIFAHNLVAGVVSSVCDGYFNGMEDKDFTPSVVEDCVQSIYDGYRP